TLKNLQGSNFKKFREVFKAEFKGGFMVPADTFDNVKGQFPIGFLVWDTSSILPKENPLNLGGNSKEEKQNSNLILDQDNLKYNPLKEHFCLLDINAPNRKMFPQSRTRTKGTQRHSTTAPFNPPKQKSQSSLAFGMNATNSWYNIPIHSYLAQEVRKVTLLEI
ncbi:hypothetical protein RGC63_07950, partial [Helicobacter pylori]|nr:hypothetical protein [Helicobacter pylori]